MIGTFKTYYEDDQATIYLGDCRAVLPALPEVDLVLSDPPCSDQTHKGARNEALETFIDFQSTTASEIAKTLELIKLKSWVVMFNDYKHAVKIEENPPKGLRGVRVGIWNKSNYTPQFTGDRPSQGWEAISILHKSDCKMRWNGGGKKSVYDAPREHGCQHPTQKPIKLVEQLILDFSNPGELVLDPFMGSGTTLLAAKNLGRKAIGIELEEKYCKIAAERLRQGVLF